LAAAIMSSQPAVTTATIPARMAMASGARSCRGGAESSIGLTRKKSRELRCCSANAERASSSSVSPARSVMSPILARTRSPFRATAMPAAL